MTVKDFDVQLRFQVQRSISVRFVLEDRLVDVEHIGEKGAFAEGTPRLLVLVGDVSVPDKQIQRVIVDHDIIKKRYNASV